MSWGIRLQTGRENKMLKQLGPEKFDTVFALMEESFPRDEHRPYEGQKALLSNPSYKIYVPEEEEKLIAFMAVWCLSEFLFLEHFAVAPAWRNRGLGGRLLSELSALSGKRVVLEAEPPIEEMARRRIGFYVRNGFSLNSHPYYQPALTEELSPVPLQLMTTGGTLGQEEFERIKNILYSEVYHYKEV